MQYNFTILNGVYATSKTDYCTDFAGFVDVMQKQPRSADRLKSRMIFPGKLGNHRNDKGSYRTQENVECVSMLAIDHDKGFTQLSDVMPRLEKAGIEAFAHYTHRHDLLNGAIKWRLYIPLPEPLYPGQEQELHTAVKCALAVCGLKKEVEEWPYFKMSGVEYWDAFKESDGALSSHSMFTLPPDRELYVVEGSPMRS